MPTSNLNLEKLENLLRSATNERQRKMYRSLLEKARQSEPAPKKNQKSTNPKQKSSKPASSPQSISGEQKKNSTVLEVELTLQAQSQKQTVPTKTPTKDPQVNFSTDNTQSGAEHGETSSPFSSAQFFQAVGLIKGIPQLKDNKLCIQLGDRTYDLTKTSHYWHKDYGRLKQELETNGSSSMLLRVYPNIAHRSDNSENPYQHSFSLVRVYTKESKNIDREEKFVFRGIWQYVPYCSVPVISIYRNFETLKLYKRLPPVAKRFFTRPQAFPVIWDAPVEPFRYNPKLTKSEQMPRYFVEIEAVFEKDRYTVVEMLNEPTTSIPKYIKPLKKKSQLSKFSSD